MAETAVYPRTSTEGIGGGTILLDEHGQPISERVSQVLQRLAPTFVRQFSALRDEGALVDALERAGRRIVRREAIRGEVGNLEAYAWITLASVANSILRRGPARLARRTTSDSSGAVTNVATATFGSAEQVERAILIRELLDRLSPTERVICQWRLEGLTSQEIGERRGCTAAAVDVLMSRARRRLRLFVNGAPATPHASTRTARRSLKAQRPTLQDCSLLMAIFAQSDPAAHVVEL